jgi:hypothetical protein
MQLNRIGLKQVELHSKLQLHTARLFAVSLEKVAEDCIQLLQLQNHNTIFSWIYCALKYNVQPNF